MHRWCSTLTVALLVGHLVALFAEGYVQFSVTDLLVPGASDYRTTAVAVGPLLSKRRGPCAAMFFQ